MGADVGKRAEFGDRSAGPFRTGGRGVDVDDADDLEYGYGDADVPGGSIKLEMDGDSLARLPIRCDTACGGPNGFCGGRVLSLVEDRIGS